MQPDVLYVLQEVMLFPVQHHVHLVHLEVIHRLQDHHRARHVLLVSIHPVEQLLARLVRLLQLDPFQAVHLLSLRAQFVNLAMQALLQI